MASSTPKIAVVIPCYRAASTILDVLLKIDSTVSKIYCIDDGCPEKTGDLILRNSSDKRIEVLRHDDNQGVGAAVITGYRAALAGGCDIVVKIDADGQMDPALISKFVRPIAGGSADYVKGNRFYSLEQARSMPFSRRVGNLGLSFITKLSTGYWFLFDPTNGFTAVHANVLRELPLQKIARRYFFESDFLFRLNTIRAVVKDVPMTAVYGTEKSGLQAGREILPFLFKNLANTWKRIVYNYFLRDFNLASLELLLGVPLFLFGVVFGSVQWYRSVELVIPATSGTVMLAALPVVIGFQLLIGFLNFDIQNTPQSAIHPHL